MKKDFLLLICGILFVMLGCNMNNENVQKQQSTIDSLAYANQMTIEELQDYIDLVNSVSESLSYIDAAEGNLRSTNREGTPAEVKKELQDKIKNLAGVIDKQKQKLQDLQDKFTKQGKNNAKLQSIIKLMQSQLEEKDHMIAELQNDLNQRNADVRKLKADVMQLSDENSNLSSTVSSQREALIVQSDMMNEGFVRIGTKKELKQLGLLEGGNLFKRKSVATDNIDKSLFKKIDIRTYREITIPSSKPQILTPAPSGSYTLEKSGSQSILRITDANRFWSVSNYLIIQI